MSLPSTSTSNAPPPPLVSPAPPAAVPLPLGNRVGTITYVENGVSMTKDVYVYVTASNGKDITDETDLKKVGVPAKVAALVNEIAKKHIVPDHSLRCLDDKGSFVRLNSDHSVTAFKSHEEAATRDGWKQLRILLGLDGVFLSMTMPVTKPDHYHVAIDPTSPSSMPGMNRMSMSP